MILRPYNHTKKLMLDEMLLGTSAMTAVLMNKNYQYAADHTTFASMQLLGVQGVPALLTSTVDVATYYAWLGKLYYSDITDTVGSVVIHADGTVGGIDRPLIAQIQLAEEVLVSSDYGVSWTLPVFKW